MASSVAKKVGVRMTRCIDQLIELKAQGCTAYEQQVIDYAITAVRDLSERAAERLRGVGPAIATPPRHAHADPVIIAPAAPPAPKYGPDTGVKVAEPKRQIGWGERELSQNRDVDDRDDLERRRDDLLKEIGVQELSFLNGEAALLLAADTASWAAMDNDERCKAVRAKAAELEAMDDDQDPPPWRRPAILATPAPHPQDGGITF